MAREPDGELILHPSIGWRCPRCSTGTTVFYGFTPNRRCLQCASLEQPVNPAEPLLAAALADDLANNRAQEGDRPTADHTLLRCSDAWQCGRKTAFGALKVPRIVPFTTDTLMAFDAGKHHHTRLQGLLASKFGAELEVPISYKDVGIDLSGHADAAYKWSGKQRAVEIKSMKAYPFLKSAGGTDRFGRDVEAEGPKTEHLVQCGLYAHAPQLRAETCHIVYINKEDGRVAEWLVPMDDQPVGPAGEDLRALVLAELDRLAAIAADIRNGLLPWRHIPGFGLVKDPPAADSKGDPWNCRYCAWQPLCAALPASKVDANIDLLRDGLADNRAHPDEEPF
jgi:hypothetical protein